MKNIVMITLLISVNLMAVNKVHANKSDTFIFTVADGAALYKKRCAICHGEKATKSLVSGVSTLAGMDATRLARMIRAYRDQDNDMGPYTINKNSQVMREATYSISNQQISAIATYLSGLK